MDEKAGGWLDANGKCVLGGGAKMTGENEGKSRGTLNISEKSASYPTGKGIKEDTKHVSYFFLFLSVLKIETMWPLGGSVS